MKRGFVPGSEPANHDHAARTGRLHPGRRIEITVHLRHRSRTRLPVPADLRPGSELRRLRREELSSRFGADREDAARVVAFAREHDLDLVGHNRGRRTVVLSGTARALGRALGVELASYESHDGRHHAHEDPISLPSDLLSRVEGLLGLDTRPVARPHFRYLSAAASRGSKRLRRYTPPEVASLYEFPPSLDGRGQTIALLQLGGGFRRDDVAAYFRRLKVPLPRISVVRVGRARNRPTGRPKSADAEVLMDLEIAASVAPGARIVIYFATNDDRGFVDAVKEIVHDRTHRPDVLSISWGASESEWSRQAIRVVDRTFQDACHLGVTICASSGDLGASDGLRKGIAVEFPASSPHVLACGGTRLISARGRIRDEVVWNGVFDKKRWASGGGVSTRFRLPAFQRSVTVPRNREGGRGAGVPDVAANADPRTGYLVRVDGKWMHLGGTSAAAPLWAAFVARLNQGLRAPAGFLHPRLYRLRRGAFRPVTSGSNGYYTATAGWNACTGLGSPSGKKLLEALGRFEKG